MNLSVALSEGDIARSLSSQYSEIGGLTVNLVRRVLNFGAALAQAERELDSRGLLRNRKQGQGMIGWLAENCPEINYKTAMRWKSLAVKSADTLGCDAHNALCVLSGDFSGVDPEAPVEQLRERADELFSAHSLRELSQGLFDFASEDKRPVGRPVGSKSSPAPRVSAFDSALRLWAVPLSYVSSRRAALYKSASLLPLDDAKVALNEFRNLCSALDKRIKEGV